MARHREALEGDARDLDRLAAAHQMLRSVWTTGDSGRRELRVALESLPLSLRHPDLRTGPLREVGDTAEVVEVPVRDEDASARSAEPRELEAQVRGVSPWVDHRALRGAALAPDDVAVRLEGAELVSVDRQRHGGESSGSLVSAQRVREGALHASLEASRGRDTERRAVARRAALEGGLGPGRAHRAASRRGP